MTSLDTPSRATILDLLASLQRARPTAMLIISRDLAAVEHLAQRIVMLEQGRVPRSYVKTLTALAITRPITVSEISDCSAIISFAQGAIGMTSVGLNAVLVVNPRAR